MTRRSLALAVPLALVAALFITGWLYANHRVGAMLDGWLAEARAGGATVRYAIKRVNVLSLGSVIRLEKIRISTEENGGGEPVRIAEATLAPLSGHWLDFPHAARLTLRGVATGPLEAPEQARPVVEALGLEQALTDCDVRFVHNPAAQTLDLQELTVTAEGLYRLALDGAFQNLSSGLTAAPESPQFRAALDAVTLTELGLELEDRGLVDKLFIAYATANGNAESAPILRRIVTGFALGLVPEVFPAADQDMVERIQTFLKDPKLAALRIRCTQPLTFAAIGAQPVDSDAVSFQAKLETPQTLGQAEAFDAGFLLHRGKRERSTE